MLRSIYLRSCNSDHITAHLVALKQEATPVRATLAFSECKQLLDVCVAPATFKRVGWRGSAEGRLLLPLAVFCWLRGVKGRVLRLHWGQPSSGRQLGAAKETPTDFGAFQLQFLALNSEIPTSEYKWNAALMFEVADGKKDL